MSDSKNIKLAILWHMHQPDYRDPRTGSLAAPWVRLHATKDYLDMLHWATKHDNIRVTFNLVPSLIEQLDHYTAGGSDNHLELTRLNPAETDSSHTAAILENMFKCNYDKMIKPHIRFSQLFDKWQNELRQKKTSTFTVEELRDAQLWSNLVWVDPTFHPEKPVKQLLEKAQNFSEQDKHDLIQWQLNHIKKIIPAYKEQLDNGNIEISFSPFYHPILPLLCDSESAREALPDIELPKILFRHPDDAKKQILMSRDLFQNLFGRELFGLWPSEGSVSDQAIQLCHESGIKWLATGEQVLYRSLQKSGLDTSTYHPYNVYEHASGVKMLFRDHQLSDKIGFVYSNWDPTRATDDFIAHIKNVRNRLAHLPGDIVVPVILDGENCWEYYHNDGNDFLSEFYEKISTDPEIETVTMSQATGQLPATKLKSIFAGSWINHNFKIWIGHPEDNAGWTYLKNARDFLVNFQIENPDFDSGKISSCWKLIYIAEGSDWFWWYGDEHRGPDNARFDTMFRSNLIMLYEILGAEVPNELQLPIISKKYSSAVQQPDALVTPVIDGKISHFYEWFGAGSYQCEASDTTMHRVFKLASVIHFGFDHDNFYIRIDFTNIDNIKSMTALRFDILFELPENKRLEFPINEIPFEDKKDNIYNCALNDAFELAVNRKFLWTLPSGVLAFRVEINDGNQCLEQWPENGSIKCELPEKNKELFWHQ